MLNIVFQLFSWFEDFGYFLFRTSPVGVGYLGSEFDLFTNVQFSMFIWAILLIPAGFMSWFVVGRLFSSGFQVLLEKHKKTNTDEKLSIAAKIKRYLAPLALSFVIPYILSALAVTIITALYKDTIALVFLFFIFSLFPPVTIVMGLYAFALFGMFAPFIFLIFIWRKYDQKYLLGVARTLVGVFIFCCLAVLTQLAHIIMAPDLYAVYPHKFNALIKNACLIDPQKLHCPQRIEDIRVIEPSYVDTMLKLHQISYKYFPETNQYILLIRIQKRRAVLFSPMLKSITSTDGREGNDFKEYPINTIGRDRVEHLPDFAKDLEYLPEWKW